MLLKIPKSECPDQWIRFPRHKWPWSNIEDSVVPLEPKIYTDIHLLGSCGKDNVRKFYLGLGWENVPNWECVFFSSETRIISVRKTWDEI